MLHLTASLVDTSLYLGRQALVVKVHPLREVEVPGATRAVFCPVVSISSIQDPHVPFTTGADARLPGMLAGRAGPDLREGEREACNGPGDLVEGWAAAACSNVVDLDFHTLSVYVIGPQASF